MKVIVLVALSAISAFAQGPFANGNYTLKNVHSGLLLDDPGYSSMAGTQGIQWTFNGGQNQNWTLTYSAVQSGYHIENVAVPALFLTDANGAADLEPDNGAANQFWRVAAASGAVTLVNVGTGRVLDDGGQSMASGNRMITWPANGGNNQNWLITSLAPVKAVSVARALYAVNESGALGSISVYDIDNGHKLVQTIQTASNVADVRGVAASAVSGRLYMAYYDTSNRGRVLCLNIYNGSVVWDNVYTPGVDRLSMNPDGQLLYVPTNEGQYDNYINVVDANSGNVVRTVTLPSVRSHDTLYPLAGPIFQETKASDGTGRYLYMIDPSSYVVTRSLAQFHDFLGPYTVDATSSYAAADVNGVVGFQMTDLHTGQLTTALIPNPPRVGLPHGIGFTPDQTEIWQSTASGDPYVYVWDVTSPMQPVFKQRLYLSNGGSHWLTFSIKGDFAYVAPGKGSANGTDIFNVQAHSAAGTIGSSEDMLEIDFDSSGRITQAGDQFGIGR